MHALSSNTNIGTIREAYKTAITAETARYIQRTYPMIFREKRFRKGFPRTFEEV